MAINVSITTTPTQDTKLERLRLLKNGQGEDYTDVNDMAKQILISILTGEVRQLDDIDAAAALDAYRLAYLNASPDVKAQVRALLGV